METFSALPAICAGNSPVTGDFPRTMASDTELRCFICCQREPAVEQTIELAVIWDTITLQWRQRNGLSPGWLFAVHILLRNRVEVTIFTFVYIRIPGSYECWFTLSTDFATYVNHRLSFHKYVCLLCMLIGNVSENLWLSLAYVYLSITTRELLSNLELIYLVQSYTQGLYRVSGMMTYTAISFEVAKLRDWVL